MLNRIQIPLFHQHALTIRSHEHCAKWVMAKLCRLLGDIIRSPQMFYDLLIIEWKPSRVQ